MNILIDTSYFLPLIKIGIESIPDTLLIDLLEKSTNSYYYSSLTLFELTAKGLKFSFKGNLITPQDIRIGIDAIQNDTRLTEISFIDNPLILDLASQLKTIHNDTIDCLIFATAICNCDCIITMDEIVLHQLKNAPHLHKKVKEINESFKFWFRDLSDDLYSL